MPQKKSVVGSICQCIFFFEALLVILLLKKLNT